ncbi:MAG: cytochrome c oxidase assembly protein [Akkermansiaceae bacterium]
MSGAATATASAHGAPRPVHDGPWWTAWNLAQPLVVTNLSILTAIYGIGLLRLWKRGGVGKTISVRQASMFAAGMIALGIALVSPIDVFSDELAWMHMTQHMMLMGVAAPLLVLGTPFLVSLWAFPLSWRRAYGRAKQWVERWKPTRYLLWQPLLMWLLFALVLWVWHLPPLYEATLYDDLFHDFQHFSFVVAACLFWRVLLDPVSRLRLNRGAGVVYLFLTSLHATMLGVFMTLAPKAWYPFYEERAPRWNLTALQDQQVAGLIMWMPACMIYALVASLILGLWLRDDIRRAGDKVLPESKD